MRQAEGVVSECVVPLFSFLLLAHVLLRLARTGSCGADERAASGALLLVAQVQMRELAG